MRIIQTELDKVVKEWNTHTISTKKNVEGPKGKPDFMYFNPEFYGTESYGSLVDLEEVEACKELYGVNGLLKLPCTLQFVETVQEIPPDTSITSKCFLFGSPTCWTLSMTINALFFDLCL